MRRRQPGHQRLQHGVDVESRLGRDLDGARGVEADHVFDLLLDALRLGRRQVDLVEHWHDLVTGIDRLVDIGERLRLDPLAGIDHQKRAFAGSERPADLVGEVDMAGRVHEIELIGVAVLGLVGQAHGLRLDGDAALALDIHAVEHLRPHLALLEPAADLNQPVREGRFAVIDVSDDRKIADMREVRHAPAPDFAGKIGLVPQRCNLCRTPGMAIKRPSRCAPSSRAGEGRAFLRMRNA